jgi:hypothetical protein
MQPITLICTPKLCALPTLKLVPMEPIRNTGEQMTKYEWIFFNQNAVVLKSPRPKRSQLYISPYNYYATCPHFLT